MITFIVILLVACFTSWTHGWQVAKKESARPQYDYDSYHHGTMPLYEAKGMPWHNNAFDFFFEWRERTNEG